MRPIDADVLYKKTEELEKQAREASRQAITEPTQEKWNTILAERSAFKYDITQMPTIDAVPVVRCKDCKWWIPLGEETTAPIPALGECQFRDKKFVTLGCEFCFWGERKDDA